MMTPQSDQLLKCERCGWLGMVIATRAKVNYAVQCPRCQSLVYRVLTGYVVKG